MKIRITLLSLLFVSGMQAQDLRLTDTAAYLSQARIPLHPPLSFFFEKLGKPDRVRTAEGTTTFVYDSLGIIVTAEEGKSEALSIQLCYQPFKPQQPKHPYKGLLQVNGATIDGNQTLDSIHELLPSFEPRNYLGTCTYVGEKLSFYASAYPADSEIRIFGYSFH